MAKDQKTLRITLVKSPIGSSQKQKDTVRSLGLSKINQVVEKPNTPQIRGMVAKIQHLVTVEEVE